MNEFKYTDLEIYLWTVIKKILHLSTEYRYPTLEIGERQALHKLHTMLHEQVKYVQMDHVSDSRLCSGWAVIVVQLVFYLHTYS